MFSEDNTEFNSLNATYSVAEPVAGMFSRDDATVSSIGNRLYAIGDGSQEAMYLGKGPVGSGAEVYPDEQLYSQEWSRFPKCQYYARGPKATIFAAGNPDKPLTVYISEPAGLTSSFKDSPYSTEDVSDLYNAGRLSTVDILGSDASKITALSTRGDQVVVHTDKGAFLLYAPAPDQASTGYRVEQAPATNFSSAVSHKVVSGEGGTQTFWVGHDGQVYKDEAASRGSAELKSNADQDQANWKSKGVWEHELPIDLSDSFSVFSAQTGDYLFFVGSEEYAGYKLNDKSVAPPISKTLGTSATDAPQEFHYAPQKEVCRYFTSKTIDGSWSSDTKKQVTDTLDSNTDVEYEWVDRVTSFCCKKQPGAPDPAQGKYATCKECTESTDAEQCCTSDYFFQEDQQDSASGGDLIDSSELRNALASIGTPLDVLESLDAKIPSTCHVDPFIFYVPSSSRAFEAAGCTCIMSEVGGFGSYSECIASLMASGNCTFDYEDECGPCKGTPNGRFTSMEKCNAAIENNSNCKKYDVADCNCVESENGSYGDLAACESALQNNEEYKDCWESYKLDGCDCVPAFSGDFTTESECITHVKRNFPSCYGYDLDGCDCTEVVGGEFETESLCIEESLKDPGCKGYNLNNCQCEEDTSGNPQYAELWQCESAANQIPSCHTWDLDGCDCVRNSTGTGAYPTKDACLEDASSLSACLKYDIIGCSCVESANGSIQGLAECEELLKNVLGCEDYDLNSNCECVVAVNGEYNSLAECQTAQENCSNFEISDCGCVSSKTGTFSTVQECEDALKTEEHKDCWGYSANEDSCECTADPDGSFVDISTCENYLMTVNSCKKYTISDCNCVVDKNGEYSTFTECEANLELIPTCKKYSIVDCNCIRDDEGSYESKSECEYAVVTLEGNPCGTFDLLPAAPAEGRPVCTCERNADGTGIFDSYEDCETAMAATSSCDRYTINDCECKESPDGWITGLTQCEVEKDKLTECKKYQINADCVCEEAEDGEYAGLHICEEARIESCARYNIEDCECIENQETGTIVGLSNCNNEFSKEPYATDCGGWFRVGCNCQHDYAGGDFENLTDCLLAIEQDSSCDDAPWALPLPDTQPAWVSDGSGAWTPNPNGSSTDSKSECYCTQNWLTGTFATREDCQAKLLEIRGKENLFDCYGCQGSSVYGPYGGETRCCCDSCGVFAPEPACTDCVTGGAVPGNDVYYCHKDGGYDCYATLNGPSGWCETCSNCSCTIKEEDFNPEDWVRNCDPTADPNDPNGLSDCDRCPEPGYALVIDEYTGGCYCDQRAIVPGTADTFSTAEECFAAQNSTCKMFKPDTSAPCRCEETFDGSTPDDPAFETIEQCEQYVAEQDPTCEWFTISDTCQCVQDDNGYILGAARCEELVKSTPGCEDYYVNELCECVISEPEGNTDPPYRGINECTHAVNSGELDRCATYTLTPDCACIKQEDGSGEHLGLAACEAAKAASDDCKSHWIAQDCLSCTTVDPFDGTTEYENKQACEDALANNELPERCITYHWVDENCECTTTDPGDGSVKFTDFDTCVDAVYTGQIERCCNTELQYFKDDTEQACFSGQDFTPNASQCDCVEAGYDIFEL